MLRFRSDEGCATMFCSYIKWKQYRLKVWFSGIDYRFIKIRWEMRVEKLMLDLVLWQPLAIVKSDKYFSFCVPLQKDTSWGWENDIFILGWTPTLMSSNMLTVGCRESLTVILHFYECWIKHRNSGITVHALKVSHVSVTIITKP